MLPNQSWHSGGESGAWFATKAELKAYERGRAGCGHQGLYPEGHPESWTPSRDGPYERERRPRGKGGKGRGKGNQPPPQGWDQPAAASHSWGGGGGGGRHWRQAPQPSAWGFVTDYAKHAPAHEALP